LSKGEKMQLENSGRYINDLIRFNLISKNVNLLRTGFLPVILAGIFLLLVALFGVYHFNVPNENILMVCIVNNRFKDNPHFRFFI